MVYHALALSFISFISGTYNCLCALLVKVHACERDFAGSEALQLEVGAEAVDRNHGVEFDPLLAEAGSNAFTMSPTRYTKGPYCFSGSELKEQMCNRANIGSWKYYNKLLEQAVNERIIVKSYDKVGHVIYTPAPF
jgi:hypothetical protein